MTVLTRSAKLPYSAESMYRLVNNVKEYANFLPYCSKGTVIEQGEDYVIAALELTVMGVSKSFTTKNVLCPPNRIEMEHVEGPFKHLRGAWTFEELPSGGCLIELSLDFEVHNSLSGIFFGKVYRKVADELVDSFTKRAHELNQ